VGIRTLLLESLVEFLVLWDYFRFGREDTRALKIENQTGVMRRCDEVFLLVVLLKSASVSEELVNVVHTTNCHVAAELNLSYSICAFFGH